MKEGESRRSPGGETWFSPPCFPKCTSESSPALIFAADVPPSVHKFHLTNLSAKRFREHMKRLFLAAFQVGCLIRYLIGCLIGCLLCV